MQFAKVPVLNYSIPVKNFKDSKVYKLTYAQAMEIFEIRKKFPNEEKFSLMDQVRREEIGRLLNHIINNPDKY